MALAILDAIEEAEAAGEEPSRILVRDEHFQAIVDRRKEFISCRGSIHDQDKEARAYAEGNRGRPSRTS